jgi:hypothetical protein
MTYPTTQELLRELIIKLVPSLVLAGVHSYTVSKDAGGGRFDLQPAPRVLHGPRLRVEQGAAPGIEGGLNVGDKVLLVFVDNDAAQPMIVGHLPLRDGKPASLKIDATGTIRIGASASLVSIGASLGGVPRYGDTVTIGSTVGVLVFTGPFVPQGPLSPSQAQVKV